MDEFDLHEALDRTLLFGRMIETDLAPLPAIQHDQQFKRKVEEISDHLAELYQMIGAARFC